MISEDQISEVIQIIATNLRIKEWSYEKQSFKNIAQNYFGVLIPVSLFNLSNEDNVKLELVLKLAPTNEQYRVSGAVTTMFQKEIFVYTTIMPTYRKFQNDIKHLQFLIPECYHVCKEYCKEVIVMQNMCADGFMPFVESLVLDYNHILLSLKCLAQFHAMSFILKETEHRLYKDIEEICVPLSRQTNKRFMDILKDRLMKAINNFSKSQYVQLFNYLFENCEQLVEDTFKNVNGLCLCHGDVWKENFLYKYLKDEPISACLIDYQTVRLSSPAYDVLYLIVSSTTSELRHRYYPQLLNIYYETFEEILNEAQLNVGTLYSRAMFNEDLSSVAPACLIIANTAIWLSSGLQEEGHVRSKVQLNTDFEKKMAAEHYEDRLTRIIEDLKSYEYLNFSC
ncbi:uncharacterized protein LOC126970524 isoform X1 [Leptidea sinapis]|uniref:uncharacterized protein LOC126970524 isoform X1 n=1 Tax=Leptidea sinapis TaxID=189913 RepID=UPI002134FA30|nr:uncharacterized protein LOC126970524 isoform X1 [Leptidea sinapis]